MGILDEAIKEHLELKRQHGADASELKQLEDEAFGAAERPGDEGTAPDALAEAPTQFMQQPEAPPEAEDKPGRAPRAEIADLQEPPAPPEAEAPQEPAEEESPAMEHEAVPEAGSEPAPEPEPEPSAPHTTAEREAIAEQPTEMYDVEAELGAGESQAPSDEELAEEEMDEPRLAPVDPLSEADEAEDEPGAGGQGESGTEDFFDEQRLSDELDQALEAPAEEGDAVAEDEEDVLEETPDFLEEAPEDDRLWFEQKPPKDFDFDD
jgi:hypothetical protein